MPAGTQSSLKTWREIVVCVATIYLTQNQEQDDETPPRLRLPS